jgi:thioredoxin reductase
MRPTLRTPSARHRASAPPRSCRSARSRTPKIEFIWDTAVEDALDPGKGKVTAVRLKNLKTGAQWETPVDGLFVAVGHQPNTAIFKGKIDLHPNEYVKLAPGTTQTSVRGHRLTPARGPGRPPTVRSEGSPGSTGDCPQGSRLRPSRGS